jgi:hypothetical protein
MKEEAMTGSPVESLKGQRRRLFGLYALLALINLLAWIGGAGQPLAFPSAARDRAACL